MWFWKWLLLLQALLLDGDGETDDATDEGDGLHAEEGDLIRRIEIGGVEQQHDEQAQAR